MEVPLLKDLVAHAKAYGFIFPSSEIYEGLQAVYDYGPYGVQLKRNLQQLWWQSMTGLHPNIVGLDAAILMHPRTWEASGHLEGFHDYMVDNKDSRKRYRVDHLIEERAEHYKAEEDEPAAGKLLAQMHAHLIAENLLGLHQLLIDHQITCPVSNTANWTEVRKLNLMFSTQAGALESQSHTLYLRPETAQGIFVNFLNVQKTARMKVPFGIAQVGKAFRNELIARQFIFRMREFEQMEMQFFVAPDESNQWFEYWSAHRHAWHQALGIPSQQLQITPHQQLAHYAEAAVDIEYHFPFGFKEVEGIHARTDFDLKRHEAYAKKKLQYFDPQRNTSYTPYVIETSIGLDRLVLMTLCHAYQASTDETGKPRCYLRFHPAIAPRKAAIMPLMKKDGLAERAQELFNQLRYNFMVGYDEGQSIGKRYARQDALGTPFCLTIDHQTLEDDTITLRHRDDMRQERMPIKQVADFLTEQCNPARLLRQLPAMPAAH